MIYENHLEELKKDLIVKVAENNKVNSEINRIDNNNIKLFDAIDNGGKAIELIERIASMERMGIKNKIEHVVSDALQMIYGKGHSIEIEYSIKRNRSSVDIYYIKETTEGIVKRSMGGFGGGVADTIAFPLKLLILLASNISDRIFIADEPGKHIDTERVEKFGEFLKELNNSLQLQLIICTHHQSLKDYADVVYEVNIDKDNSSKVTLIKNRDVIEYEANILKRVRLINFESHKDTTVEFNGGVNLIVGESDCGKSSIIRAIKGVAYNIFDNDSLRIGEKRCTIELESTNGIVRLHKGDANDYEVIDFRNNNKKYEFKTVGKTVPEIVYEITGLRPLVIGDIFDIPNISFQLDKHYMLSEVNGAGCNSNMIARIVDNVVGLGGIEELINKISSEMAKNKRTTTVNLNTITDLRNSLNSEYTIKDLEEKINIFERLFKDVQERLKHKSIVKDILDKYDALKIDVDAKLMAFDDKVANELLLEVEKTNIQYQKLFDIMQRLSVITHKKQAITKQLNEIADIDSSLMIALESEIKQYENVFNVFEKYNSLSLDIKNNESSLMLHDKDFKEYNEKLSLFKEKNPFCPLCEKPFNEGCDDN